MTKFVPDDDLSDWLLQHSWPCRVCGVRVIYDPLTRRFRDVRTDALHVCPLGAAPSGPAEPGARSAPDGGSHGPYWFGRRQGRRNARPRE